MGNILKTLAVKHHKEEEKSLTNFSVNSFEGPYNGNQRQPTYIAYSCPNEYSTVKQIIGGKLVNENKTHDFNIENSNLSILNLF